MQLQDTVGETVSLLPAKAQSGALREGQPLQLCSKEAFALFAQYAGVELVSSTLPNTITPFLTYYLNMEGAATTSARALVQVVWALKVFMGILLDCVPIGGYRRRPYMVIGWIITATCLFAMACIPIGEPYFPDPELRHIRPEDYTPQQEASLNKGAPSTGGVYIVLMMMSSFGCVLADVASDGLFVEYAQREPIATRGHIQSAVSSVRALFQVVAQLITGFGLSSPPYGGDFDFGISFPTTMLILAVFCLPVIPMAWFFIHEKQVEAPQFKQYLDSLWLTIQSRAVYQVVAYSFFSGVFASFTYVANDPITSYWVRASSFSLSISGIVGGGVVVTTIVLTGMYGLNWNWHTIQVATTLSTIAVDAVCTMSVTWDVIRAPWFWVGLPIAENVPAAITSLLTSLVVAELVGQGNEAAVFGLMTTVPNLGVPVGFALTKIVNAPFKVHNDDILNDTYEVRRDVTITILISYVMSLLSLAFLPLLPRQRAETQELRKNGGGNSVMGAITIAYLFAALSMAVFTNLQSIFESE
ncbi:Folate-biopterin transporter, partial [Globisporangium splendens]